MEITPGSFTLDIKKTVPSSVDTVIVEIDGTWRSEDNKHGTAKQVGEAKMRASEMSLTAPPNGKDEHRNGSAGLGPGFFSNSSSKDGTPFEVKPDLTALGNHINQLSKGKIKKNAAEVIDLDGDDDGDEYSNEYLPPTPKAPPRPAPGFNRLQQPKTAGAIIDLTLSDSDEDRDIDGGPVPYKGKVNESAVLKRVAESDWEDSDSQRGRWE